MTATGDRVLVASDQPFELRMCPHLMPPREPAVRQIRTPAGDEAWLVSGFAEVRELFNDDRLGRSHPAPADGARYAGNPAYDQVTATDHEMADGLHAMLRDVLKPHFSARRIMALRPRLEELAVEQLDRLRATAPPAELRTEFSEPLILRVLCLLLGVPAGEEDRCVALMQQVGTGDIGGLLAYLGELVARKRTAPDESLTSKLSASGGTDEQVVQIAMLLLSAGFGATAKQIAYGFLLLAGNPAQRDALAADPELIPAAVEEMLRVSGSTSLPRYARTDIEIAGVTIREDDLVLLDLTMANFDDAGFTEPATFDIHRTPNRHVTFGHGVWTCIGAPLARLLLRTVVATVLTRLPTLRPATDLEPYSGPLSGGLPERLPVTW